MESIGNRIAKYRKEKALTQEALAEKMGVSSQAVSKWENDASCPDISLLPQLCKELGITTDELLTGKSEKVQVLPESQRKPLEELTFRVRMDSAEGDRIRVNFPMTLVKLCMEIGVDVVPNVGGDNAQMLKSIDMEKVVKMVEQGLVGKLVEIESADGDIVEVVVE
jgi:transcriptional regulator with XRE-family HTH domain